MSAEPKLTPYSNLTNNFSMFGRILSLQNREPFSKTYGCFDRTYWAWKFTDFPGARFQEGIFTLAWFYENQTALGNFNHQENILKWIEAGLDYWCKIQYPNGSFDEAYPYEQSLAAVAFTGFYVGEAFLKVSSKLSKECQEKCVHAFQKAGQWLCENDEKHGMLTNHIAAAAAALEVIFQITKEARFKNRSRYFLEKIYDHQSTEGWYEEYGGADPGYQSHAIFYLARIYQYTKDQTLLQSLIKAVQFQVYTIHPNGTLGGDYASRNTEFYFPAGFEMLSQEIPEAKAIAGFMRQHVSTLIGPQTVDAYNIFPLLNNYLFASDHISEGQSDTSLPFEQNISCHFPKAGLMIHSNAHYYSILGIFKGGTLVVYNKADQKCVFRSAGYWLKTAGGKVAASQYPRHETEINFETSKDLSQFSIRSDFKDIKQTIMTPFLFLGFRGFTTTLGRLGFFAMLVKRLLVKVLIYKKSKMPLKVERQISFKDDSIDITDDLSLSGNLQLESLFEASKFSPVHMGSARYFQQEEIEMPLYISDNLANELNRQKKVQRKTVIKI